MLARGEDAMPMDMNKFRRAFPVRLLYPALLFCGAAAAAFHAGQASQFGMTLRHSIPILIILAVMLQIIITSTAFTALRACVSIKKNSAPDGSRGI